MKVPGIKKIYGVHAFYLPLGITTRAIAGLPVFIADRFAIPFVNEAECEIEEKQEKGETFEELELSFRAENRIEGADAFIIELNSGEKFLIGSKEEVQPEVTQKEVFGSADKPRCNEVSISYKSKKTLCSCS